MPERVDPLSLDCPIAFLTAADPLTTRGTPTHRLGRVIKAYALTHDIITIPSSALITSPGADKALELCIPLLERGILRSDLRTEFNSFSDYMERYPDRVADHFNGAKRTAEILNANCHYIMDFAATGLSQDYLRTVGSFLVTEREAGRLATPWRAIEDILTRARESGMVSRRWLIEQAATLPRDKRRYLDLVHVAYHLHGAAAASGEPTLHSRLSKAIRRLNEAGPQAPHPRTDNASRLRETFGLSAPPESDLQELPRSRALGSALLELLDALYISPEIIDSLSAETIADLHDSSAGAEFRKQVRTLFVEAEMAHETARQIESADLVHELMSSTPYRVFMARLKSSVRKSVRDQRHKRALGLGVGVGGVLLGTAPTVVSAHPYVSYGAIAVSVGALVVQQVLQRSRWALLDHVRELGQAPNA